MRNLSPSIALDRFLASIKWQELDPPGQIQLLQAIREIGHLSHLMIKGSTILEDSLLILLGKSLPKLERMTLLHCSQISENGLCGLIIANPTLHLVIGGCQKIKAREYFFLSHHSQNLSIQFATGEICRIDKTTPIPIHPAIHANEEEAFYLFLSLNTIRNSQDQEGYSALHLVVKMADRLREKAKNYLAALVFCGESLEFKDLSHETPLEKAERYSLERESYQELTCYLKRLENPLEVLREALPLRSKWADLINYRALWAQFVHQQAQTTPFIHLFPKPFDEITEMTLLNPLTEEQFIFIEKNCPNLSSLNCQFQLTLKQRQKFSRLLSDKSP